MKLGLLPQPISIIGNDSTMTEVIDNKQKYGIDCYQI
jgi:hypothetical protein